MSDLQPAGNESKSLLDLTTGVFSLILSLRHGSDFGDAEHLRRQINNFLAGLDKAGVDAGFIREDLEKAKFALVVFLDEIILDSQWASRESWRDNPLQLALFGERGGGSRFFTELDTLRSAGAQKRDVLEIYHLCLTLGFQGKFRISGKSQLDAIIADLRNQLGYDPRDFRELKISPHGKARDRSVALVKDSFPFWKFAALGAGIILVLFTIFFFTASYQTGQVIDAIPTLAG
jgi:type VI secretion system protein ImpK